MTSCDVLIVEDEALLAEDLSDRLEGLGHQVVGIADTRRGAVRAVQLHRPHVVLMDIRLKGDGDGVDAADEIQGRHGVPVVYLTAHSDDATTRRALATAPFGYLTKPVREADLRLAVETAVRRHAAERSLRTTGESTAGLVALSGELIHTCTPDGRLVRTNPAWHAATGYSADEAGRMTMWDLVHPGQHAHCREVFTRVLAGEPSGRLEVTFVAKGGGQVVVEGVASGRFEGGRATSVQCVFRDVTVARWQAEQMRAAKEQAEAKAEALWDHATRDALTGTWNRRMILEKLAGEVARADRSGQCVAAVLIDLDHFKRVNDTHGHPAGDAVLAEAGRRLRSAVRPYDTVGRYGGEEFLAVLAVAPETDPADLGERFRRAVATDAVDTPGGRLVVTATVGVAVRRPGGAADPADLILRADEALYRAKAAGRNRVELADSPEERP